MFPRHIYWQTLSHILIVLCQAFCFPAQSTAIYIILKWLTFTHLTLCLEQIVLTGSLQNHQEFMRCCKFSKFIHLCLRTNGLQEFSAAKFHYKFMAKIHLFFIIKAQQNDTLKKAWIIKSVLNLLFRKRLGPSKCIHWHKKLRCCMEINYLQPVICCLITFLVGCVDPTLNGIS